MGLIKLATRPRDVFSKIKTFRKSSNKAAIFSLPRFYLARFPSPPLSTDTKNTRSYVQLAWGCGRISEQPGLRLEDTTRVVVVVWKDVYAITSSVSFFRKKKAKAVSICTDVSSSYVPPWKQVSRDPCTLYSYIPDD